LELKDVAPALGEFGVGVAKGAYGAIRGFIEGGGRTVGNAIVDPYNQIGVPAYNVATNFDKLPSAAAGLASDVGSAVNEKLQTNEGKGEVIGALALAALTPRALAETKPTLSAKEQLAQNKAQGKAFEQSELKKLAETQDDVAAQVQVKTQSGTKTVLDAVGKKNGNIAVTEMKSSPTAPLTKNQKTAFPEIAQTGAIVVSRNKPGYPAGTQIPPTTVNVVRPPAPKSQPRNVPVIPEKKDE
jgi:hypothetical protein